MNKMAEFPAWRILQDPDGSFIWVAFVRDGPSLPAERARVLTPMRDFAGSSCMPSMSELFVSASAKLDEGDDGIEEGVPMFKTASGRSVTLRQSSLRKAEVVLGDSDRAGGVGVVPTYCFRGGNLAKVSESSFEKASSMHNPHLREGENIPDGELTVPMFQTGLGRPVELEKTSVKKAFSILQEKEKMETDFFGIHAVNMTDCEHGVPMFQTGSGKPVSLKQSSIKKAISIFQEEDEIEMANIPDKVHGVPMFHTSSGRPVSLKQSSINKALSIFRDKDETEMANMSKKGLDVSMFQTGLGGPVGLKQSSIKKALSIFQEEDHVEKANMPESEPSVPMFLTGLGRPVGLKQSSIEKALSILQEKEGVEIGMMQRANPSCGFGTCEADINNSSYSDEATYHPTRDMESGWKNSSANSFQTGCPLSAPISHPIEFQTAGGRSLPISDDAIRRAKILLGDDDTYPLLNGNPASYSIPIVSNDKLLKIYEMENKIGDKMLHVGNRLMKNQSNTREVENLTRNREKIAPRAPLANITNRGSGHIPSHVLSSGEKRGQGRENSISPFKRPRSSRFTTPMRKDFSSLDSGQSHSSFAEICCPSSSLSTHYPPRQRRKSINEFFGGPPSLQLSSLPNDMNAMNPEKAAAYKFKVSPDCEGIGPDGFQDLLIKAGASSLNATKEWVQNHYKWIIWKLASLERGYPELARAKYLTTTNVLEELKYRYEREVKHGHRSAVKRILDGDASPSSILVLCVSAIHPVSKNYKKATSLKIGEHDGDTDNLKFSDIPAARKIELTDGWYSINANLDSALSNHATSGSIFVGQKLRIWGSTLLGWAGTVSCLEAWKSVSLQLHINGTYRAHWAERLGFRKGFRFPLAFSSIKPAGGQVPKTLVGVLRIYPILYKERLPDGGSVVRSEKMENKVLYLQNQRRLLVAEEIMLKQDKFLEENEEDSEEGATIFKLLETSAEPDVLMAEMSSQQLISVSNYQAKKEVKSQNAIVKKIEKALEEEGLGSRDVSSFMRVRVMGLNPRGSSRKKSVSVQGLVVIWNPTKQQRADLEEGQMYSVSGLTPLSACHDTLHLQARGTTSTWTPLPPSATELFEPFFRPRFPVQLSSLGKLPISSEFDAAVIIVHVGEVFSSGHVKKQWIFVTDGSWEEHHCCLLAISLCLPAVDPDHSLFFSPTLSGCHICFCNLVKRARDEPNGLWVADATENSIWSRAAMDHYSLLKEAAGRVEKWAHASPLVLGQLQERVLCIIDGGCSE
ncbi:protein BREAST CANCER SUSCEPTIBILITY 2 homolog B-like isoform X2 [Wolffia australiana]